MRPECKTLLSLAENIPENELIIFLAELEAVRLTATRRLFAPVAPQQEEVDRYLNIEEAARVSGMSADFLYRHSQRFGGQKIGSALRFSQQRLQAALKRSRS